jgi:hypothetical protein
MLVCPHPMRICPGGGTDAPECLVLGLRCRGRVLAGLPQNHLLQQATSQPEPLLAGPGNHSCVYQRRPKRTQAARPRGGFQPRSSPTSQDRLQLMPFKLSSLPHSWLEFGLEDALDIQSHGTVNGEILRGRPRRTDYGFPRPLLRRSCHGAEQATQNVYLSRYQNAISSHLKRPDGLSNVPSCYKPT